MKIKLQDGAPRSKGEVTINVSKNGNTIEIGVDDYVAPVVLEYYEGKLNLRVYGENGTPDICQRLTFTPKVSIGAEIDAAIAPVAAREARVLAVPVSVIDKPTAQETVNAVFPPPADADADADLDAFDAA